MIDDSRPWKHDLWRIAQGLERKRSQRRWSEHSRYLVERDVMIAAYAIRKLMEAFKLSDEVTAQEISAARFPLIGRAPDYLNLHHFDRYYDWDNGENVKIRLSAFCNWIIHSFIWVMCQEESGGFSGVIFSSDHERRNAIYLISADVLIDLLRSVAYDEVVAMTIESEGYSRLPPKVQANNS